MTNRDPEITREFWRGFRITFVYVLALAGACWIGGMCLDMLRETVVACYNR